MFPPRKTKCSKRKTKCICFRHPPKPYKKIALERLSCQILTLFLYLLPLLSYHNFKALHIGELQAAIFRCLEKLLLVNCLDGYLYLGIGKV